MHKELCLQHPKVSDKYSSKFHTAAAMPNFYRNPQKAPLQMHKLRSKPVNVLGRTWKLMSKQEKKCAHCTFLLVLHDCF